MNNQEFVNELKLKNISLIEFVSDYRSLINKEKLEDEKLIELIENLRKAYYKQIPHCPGQGGGIGSVSTLSSEDIYNIQLHEAKWKVINYLRSKNIEGI